MKTMRPHHVGLPLALLSAAFMLGCSETSDPAGPNADAPVPNFAHNDNAPDGHGGGGGGGGETEDARFRVSTPASDDVEVVDGVLIGPGGGKNNLQNEFGELVTINLTDFRALGTVAGGTACFSTVDIFSIMMVSQVTPSNIEDAVIRFFFDAKGTNGTTDVSYALRVLGTFESFKPWPPTTGNSNTITGVSFVLVHGNGPGNKVACTGEGTITFTLLVELLLAA